MHDDPAVRRPRRAVALHVRSGDLLGRTSRDQFGRTSIIGAARRAISLAEPSGDHFGRTNRDQLGRTTGDLLRRSITGVLAVLALGDVLEVGRVVAPPVVALVGDHPVRTVRLAAQRRPLAARPPFSTLRLKGSFGSANSSVLSSDQRSLFASKSRGFGSSSSSGASKIPSSSGLYVNWNSSCSGSFHASSNVGSKGWVLLCGFLSGLVVCSIPSATVQMFGTV